MKRYNLKYLLIILMASITMTVPAVAAESPVSLVEKGNAAYNAGNYDDALSSYDQAAKERPSDARIEFNRGAAFFRKGELDKAKDAWEKAALGATEIPLEAESLYNLGTLEFSKAAQTQTADPKAALEAGDRSVRYYHEAKDLLDNSPKDRNNPLIKEASENIEMVRQTMKSIRELLARQQEMAQNQKQATEDLKNLINQQQDLNARTQGQAAASPPPEAETPDKKPQESGQPEKASLRDMAREQAQLQEQTKKTTEKLTGSDAASKASQASSPPTPDPAQAAGERLKEAQTRQKDAAEKLNAEQASEATKDQEAALEKMKNALDLLQYKENESKNGQSTDGQKQPDKPSDQAQQQGQKEQKQDAQPKNQQNQTAAQNQENSPEPKSDSPMVQLPDDADRILGEEKENKKIRQQAGSGGYQDVDKDW